MKEIWGKVVYETIEEIVDPKHTAVLVIDIQNDNTSPNGFLAKNGRDISWARAILTNVRKVLEEARKRGMLVIFTRNTKSKDGRSESPAQIRHLSKSAHARGSREYEREDTWGNEVLDELEPRPNEIQIVKYRSSSFHGTRLEFILKNSKIETAVVMGLVTEGCVESTVRDILGFGYYPAILSDCVTTSRRDLHEAALLVMSARYDAITSDQLIKAWIQAQSTVSA